MPIHISIPLILVFASPNAVANAERALNELEGKVDSHSKNAIYSLYITKEKRALKANEYAIAPGQISRLPDILDEVRDCPVVAHHNFVQTLYIADSDSMNIEALGKIESAMQEIAAAMRINLVSRFAWLVRGNMLRMANRQADQLKCFQEDEAWQKLANLILLSDVRDTGAKAECNLYKVAVLTALRLSRETIAEKIVSVSFAKIGKPQEEIDRLLRYRAAEQLKEECAKAEHNPESLFRQELAQYFRPAGKMKNSEANNLAEMTKAWVKKLLPKAMDALSMPRAERETNIERLKGLAQTFVEDNVTSGQSAIMNAASAHIETMQAEVLQWIRKRAHMNEVIDFFAEKGAFQKMIDAALEDSSLKIVAGSDKGYAGKGFLEKHVDFQNRIILQEARALIDQETRRITRNILSKYGSMREGFHKEACSCRERMKKALKKYVLEAAEYASLQRELPTYDEAIQESFDEGKVSVNPESGVKDMYPEGEECEQLWQNVVEEIVCKLQASNGIFSQDFWASFPDWESIMNRISECAAEARPLLYSYIGRRESHGATRYIPQRFSTTYAAVNHKVEWVDCDSVEVLELVDLRNADDTPEGSVWHALEMCPAFGRSSFNFEAYKTEDEDENEDAAAESGADYAAEGQKMEKETAQNDEVNLAVENNRIYISWIWQGGPRADARVICRDSGGNCREAVCTSGQFAVAGNRVDITQLVGYGRNEITVKHLNVAGELKGVYTKPRRVNYEIRRAGASKVDDDGDKTAMDVFKISVWGRSGTSLPKSVIDMLCVSRTAGAMEGELKYRMDYDSRAEAVRKSEGDGTMECVFHGVTVPQDRDVKLSVFPEFAQEIELHKA